MPFVPHTASVVIPCYNYAQFLGTAVESALRQSRPPREVIVVDDGSTDDSRGVMRSFGNRVRTVFKENGGHASAMNAGFRMAEGEVLFTLDADDELCPEAVETVLDQWRPDTVMLHWRPTLVDARGLDLHGTVPAPWIPLDEGDVRGRLLATGGYATTVTCGLAFRRDALLRVLPIPEERFRQGADGYLVRAIPFLGPVQAIDRPLARYRRHGTSDSAPGSSAAALAETFRRRIARLRGEFETVKQLAREHGLEAPHDLGERSPEYLYARLSSLAVDPARHPLPADSRLRLLAWFMAAEARAASPPARRLAVVALVSVLAVAPPRLAWRLLNWWHDAAARPPWLARVGGRLARGPSPRAPRGAVA
jgi:GT2 family glycosyltransferase